MTRPGISQPTPDRSTDPQGPAEGVAPEQAKSTKPSTMREFERALRSLGYSRREAEAIAERGFQAAIDGGDQDPNQHEDYDELAVLIKRNIQSLKDES